MTRNEYTKFNYWLLGLVVVGLLLIAGFNYFVDPYGVWMAPKVKRINAYKPLLDGKNGLRVTWEIRRKRPQALIFGTSTSKQLSRDELASATGVPASNAGLVMAALPEIRSMLELAIAEQPDIERVFLSLDFLQFNGKGWIATKGREPSTETTTFAQESLSLLFSVPGLKASASTVVSNTLEAASTKKPLDRTDAFAKHFEVVKTSYVPFELSESALDDLQAIVSTAKANGIDLQVAISPMHANHLETLYAQGLGGQYEQWMREVTAITPVWDFSGYSSVTMEPVSDTMKYYTDPLHYSVATGEMVIRRVYSGSQEPTGFGVLVTSSTVEARIADTAAMVRQRSNRGKP